MIRRRGLVLGSLALGLLLSLDPSRTCVKANDDAYYNAYQNNGDDYYAAVDDQYQKQGDDAANNQYGNGGDDAYANQNDDGNMNYNNGDDGKYQVTDDDKFEWNQNVGFEGVSVMPLSCINYNNGHMIKFELYDSAQSYQCHFAEISTFVVSIAHYMRAYFNYRAITEGKSFSLPDDAAYLNCVQINSVYTSNPLYAKIGCMERETFTSTKLQIRVYTDAQCSQPYNDGQSARKHASKGYQVGDSLISSKVSFGLPFYSCLTCAPTQISDNFNKMNGNWYDDDFISQKQEDVEEEEEQNDDQNAGNDDAANNDDANGDDGNQQDDGGGYNYNYYDDYYGGRKLSNRTQLLTASKEDLKAYHVDFWGDFKRKLNDQYNIGDWNMCQRIYKYGLWCDEECQSLDFFRTDEWSKSDICLLGIICTFLAGMVLLVVAKRLKAQQKARLYGDDQPMPGLPPFAMTLIFVVAMMIIVALATLKFINETLIFAVVTCILLFIYMLKLTLFENKRLVVLAAPRHDMFDNINLDDHLMS